MTATKGYVRRGDTRCVEGFDAHDVELVWPDHKFDSYGKNYEIMRKIQAECINKYSYTLKGTAGGETVELKLSVGAWPLFQLNVGNEIVMDGEWDYIADVGGIIFNLPPALGSPVYRMYKQDYVQRQTEYQFEYDREKGTLTFRQVPLGTTDFLALNRDAWAESEAKCEESSRKLDAWFEEQRQKLDKGEKTNGETEGTPGR